MNKKIIFFVLTLLPALSHGMEYNEELSEKLIQISFDRYNSNVNKESSFSQTQELLTKGANPDSRKSLYDPTPLMLAIYHTDKKYAQLFINHNANLEVTAPYPGKKGYVTALEMEQTGWLQKMVDESKPQTRKKRNYNY